MVRCALKDLDGKWVFPDPKEILKIGATGKPNQTKITYLNGVEFIVEGSVEQNRKFLKK